MMLNIGDFRESKQVARRFPRAHVFRNGGVMMEGLATLPLQIEEKEREEGKQDEELCFFFLLPHFPPTN